MADDIIIRQPDPEEHRREGSLLIEQARDIVVTNNDEWELAGLFLQNIDGLIKRVKLAFDGTDTAPGPVALAHKAWKSGVALRDKALEPAEEAKSIVVAVRRKYEFEVEQKRLAEARKAEQKAFEEAQARRKKEIEEARKLGDREAASQLKQAPLDIRPAAPKTPEVPKVAGQRRSAPIWDFTITNENLIPDKFWIVDEGKVRAHVKAFGLNHDIPGITVFDARSKGA